LVQISEFRWLYVIRKPILKQDFAEEKENTITFLAEGHPVPSI